MADILELRKSVKATAFSDDRRASGIASPFLEMDRHGDVMLPGCFKGADQAFADGDAVVMLNHWEPLPIGICTKAQEGSEGLEVEFVYHTTPAATDAYTVAKERHALGKGTGLSVGIRLSRQGFEEFENGQQLLNYLSHEGIDEAQIKNIDKVRARAGYCQVVKRVDELFEFSQVPVGAAYSAQTTHIKNVFGSDGSLAGLPLAEHLEVLLAGIEGGVARLNSYSGMRADEGRNVSRSRLAQAKSLHSQLGELVQQIEKGYATPPIFNVLSLKAEAEAFLLENQPS